MYSSNFPERQKESPSRHEIILLDDDEATSQLPVISQPSPQPSFSPLTAEQRERIRVNKAAALAKRAELQRHTVPLHPWVSLNHTFAPDVTQESKKIRRDGAALPCQPYEWEALTVNGEAAVVPVVGKPPKQAKLSPQQAEVLAAIHTGQSVFFTGSAGTGKSFLIEHAIHTLRLKHGPHAVYVTASTGFAACNIGGTTLHSFAGIGLGIGDKETLLDKVATRRESKNRWQNAKALLIDEISMIDSDMFDNLDFIARRIRKVAKPFGGIQIIVTGDFFQLPPVSQKGQTKKFAFEAAAWEECFSLQTELTFVYRQADQEFVRLLNEIRIGHCSRSAEQRLRLCSSIQLPPDGIATTKLYPHKVDVARENDERLRYLDKEELTFVARDEGTEYSLKLLDGTRSVKRLALKVGAQVMLLKNLDTAHSLSNGSRGVVVGFCAPDDPRANQFGHLKALVAVAASPSGSAAGMWPVVKFAATGEVRVMGPEEWVIEEGHRQVAKRTQVPLGLAWALSVHKSQGMTLDRVESDLSRAFDCGMVYVALSRVRSLEGLHLTGFDPSKVKVSGRGWDGLPRRDADVDGPSVP